MMSVDRGRSDSHDGEFLGAQNGAVPKSEVVEEDPLHIHRLFIRGQFARTDPNVYGNNDGMIDYPSEISSVIFLKNMFVFLYDNRVYRSGFYDNYHYPILVTERRVIAICLINEKLSQILVLYEEKGEMAFLVLQDNVVDHPKYRYSTGHQRNNESDGRFLPSVFEEETLNYFVQADFKAYKEKYELLMNGNQYNGNQYSSPLQENYSIDLKYFPQFGLIVYACNPALDSMDCVQEVNKSKVLEILIKDSDESASILTAAEVLNISCQYLHNESLFSIWSGFDTFSAKMKIFLATAYQDNIILLWQVRLSVNSGNNMDECSSEDGDDLNEIFEEDEKEMELAELAKLKIPATLIGSDDGEENEEDNDENDEDESDENASIYSDHERLQTLNTVQTDLANSFPLDAGIEISLHEQKQESKSANDQRTLIQENRKLTKIKTKHKAWITSLSEPILSDDESLKNQIFVASGDKIGSIGLYCFSSHLLDVHRTVYRQGESDDQNESEKKKKVRRSRYDSKQGPWKLCDFRNNITGQHAITLLRLQTKSVDHISSKLFVGDQSGNVTVLDVSHKTNKMHIMQVLSLFSSFGGVSTLSVTPLMNEFSCGVNSNNSNQTGSLSRINSRIRCYSKDSGEAIECLLSPKMSSIFKLWPESIVQEKHSKYSAKMDSSVYKSQSLIDCCFTLIEKNIIIVCDFTKQMHLYDIRTGMLLLSVIMPTESCTCLLALPYIYTIKRPFQMGVEGVTHNLNEWLRLCNEQQNRIQDDAGITVISGHKSGEVHIYHMFFPTIHHGETSIIGSKEMGSLVAGSSHTSSYHLNNFGTFLPDESCHVSEERENNEFDQTVKKDRGIHRHENGDNEDVMSTSQDGMEDEVFDLLEGSDIQKQNDHSISSKHNEEIFDNDEGSLQYSINNRDEVNSDELHIKHHHHYLPQTPKSNPTDGINELEDETFHQHRHPHYDVVESLRFSPLQVTDLFFSSTGQYLIVVHIKRFLFLFRNDLHYKSLNPVIESKLKQQRPVDTHLHLHQPMQSTVKSGKENLARDSQSSVLSTVSKRAPVVGPNVSKPKSKGKTPLASDDPTTLLFPKDIYQFVRQVELDHNIYSITELIPANLDDETSTDEMNGDRDGSSLETDREIEVGPNGERLILIITGPELITIGLFNALDGSYITKFPCPTIPLNMINTATSSVTSCSVQSRVRFGLIWDFAIKGSQERSLVGLCPTTNPDQYVIFNELNGFQLLYDKNHMTFVQQQAFQNQHFVSTFNSSWQRDHFIGIEGFTVKSSPIVTMWSPYHGQLLRIQLHRERGLMLMRSKHYFTHNIPHGNIDQQNHSTNNRIVSIKPLKKSSHFRNHRVLVVLSNGYGIVLHL